MRAEATLAKRDFLIEKLKVQIANETDALSAAHSKGSMLRSLSSNLALEEVGVAEAELRLRMLSPGGVRSQAHALLQEEQS